MKANTRTPTNMKLFLAITLLVGIAAAAEPRFQALRAGAGSAGNKVTEGLFPKVGGWGGKCVCPDGTEYFVGDNHDQCATLACIGGKSGACNKRDDAKWKGKKVVCAPAPKVDCVMGSWEEKDANGVASKCMKDGKEVVHTAQGEGKRMSSRKVKTPASGGGKACEALQKTKVCKGKNSGY